jgi:hypothetical protein
MSLVCFCYLMNHFVWKHFVSVRGQPGAVSEPWLIFRLYSFF